MHRTTSRKQKNGTVNDDEVYITRGYFGTLDKALERLGEEMVREKLKAGSPSLQEAVHTIRECRDEWRRLVEEVTIRNCRDCTINVYPSQTKFVEEKANDDT
jgi:hypothetical protein